MNERAMADASFGAPASNEVQSVVRAFALLTAFSESSGKIRMTELVRRCGLTTSTTHRLLRTLVACEILRYDSDTEHYSAGPSLLQMSMSVSQRADLFGLTALLGELATETRESASIGIRAGTCVFVVLRAKSPEPLHFDRPAGTRTPLHVSAMGKVLLAFSTDTPRAAAESVGEMARQTPFTKSTVKAFEADLRLTKAQGYGFADEENYVGLRSIASPVCDDRGIAIASVGIQGPITRITDDRIATLVDAVARCAARVADFPASRHLFERTS